MDELKDAALSYAARGWAVFRLQEMGKVPFRGSNGVLDATSDPAQIAALWDETPNANIGIAAGASGLLLVDVDNKDGRDGFTSWDVQRVTHLVDDTTPHVWTPHNGKHLYFAAPPGLELRNTDDELGPGIETKANGKYLVAPPSRLPDGVYRWDERLNLDTVPLAMFPPSLAAQIVKQPKVAQQPLDYRPTSDTAATIVDALRHLDPWAGSYEWWLDILMGIHNALPRPCACTDARMAALTKCKQIMCLACPTLRQWYDVMHLTSPLPTVGAYGIVLQERTPHLAPLPVIPLR